MPTSPGWKVLAYTDATGRGGGEMSLGHLVAALEPAHEVTVMGVTPEVVDAVAAGRPRARRVLLPVVRGPWDLGRAAAHVRCRSRPRRARVHRRADGRCLRSAVSRPRTVNQTSLSVEIRGDRPDRQAEDRRSLPA